MALFSAAERQFVESVGRLAHCNPFTPERIECERAALGSEFDPREPDWNIRFESHSDHPNLERLLSRAETLLEQSRSRIARRANDLSDSDAALYEDLLLTTVYHRHRRAFDELIREGKTREGIEKAVNVYKSLLSDVERHTQFSHCRLPLAEPVPLLLVATTV